MGIVGLPFSNLGRAAGAVVSAVSSDYLAYLLSTGPYAYWPMNEANGTLVRDQTLNGYNGAYSGGIVLGNEGVGDGRTSALWAGTNPKADVYSIALRDRFNGNLGTFSVFMRMADAADWTNSAWPYACRFASATAGYSILIDKPSSNNRVNVTYTSNSQAKGYSNTIGPAYGTNWFHLAVSWDVANDVVKGYFNGALKYTGTGIVAWQGLLNSTTCYLGNTNWLGYMAHAALWDKVLTESQIWRLSAPTPRIRIGFFGDSTVASPAPTWNGYRDLFGAQYRSGLTSCYYHDKGGSTVIDNVDVTKCLSGQVAAAASDPLDMAVIGLGTNDGIDQAAILAAARTGLQALKANHPGIRIYWVNVLPKTGDGAGLDAIRATIASACVAEGATCWDTKTVPWIVVADDTSDGVHPNEQGAAKITQRMLAALGQTTTAGDGALDFSNADNSAWLARMMYLYGYRDDTTGQDLDFSDAANSGHIAQFLRLWG